MWLCVDDHKITFVNEALGFTVLDHIRGMHYGILVDLYGVFVILCPLVYRFIPPVIHLLVLGSCGWQQ